MPQKPLQFAPFAPFKPLAPDFSPPFHNYDLDAAFYDEMFDAKGLPRDSYLRLHQRLRTIDPKELQGFQKAADMLFLNQGITFTVYGNEGGTERIFPYDLLPRIITGKEWETIEKGLIQRMTALNLFLKDLYGPARIISERAIPRELIYTCKGFRRELRGVKPPHDIWVSIGGTDLIRRPDGVYTVLEDNLRVPSGVSYMLTSRQVMKQVLPSLFRDYDVRPVDH